ncbi:NEL-type E3 ubiquitin ligase domain-containing protein [Pseudomonas sp. B22129]|uniref:NEL-type E3 ubiquitin ligase domain-containing protein n=1 Tax=Pseudomonas sp. B22129 TaxID=3235111 RepID=UPI0037850C4B
MEKRDLSEVTEPLTEDERLAVLLDVTGDLDKARVLRQTLPPWLVEASPVSLAALLQAQLDSEHPRRQVTALLARVQPLHEFCVERLHTFLLSKEVMDVDVEHDQLELPTGSMVSSHPVVPGLRIETTTWKKSSLVEAAMRNFEAAQAKPGGVSSLAVIRSAATREKVPGLTAQQFIGYCRELDLGEAYQRHLCDVFAVPRWGEQPEGGLSYNPGAVSIGQSKRLDMQIDLHIACAKGDVSAAMGKRLLQLLKADRPASEMAFLTPLNKLLVWQGLNIDDACLWGVLVVSEDDPGSLGNGSFLVYMPNEPVRAWYEYEAWEDFKTYLTLKLQVASYRAYFQGCLDENDRIGFFQTFDQGKRLGRIDPVPVTVNFSDFYFNACTGKIQRDALALAVPAALVDEEAAEDRWMAYLEEGLDVLNVAAFFVPVIGQLMMGVAIGQILGEVFEGVEDWSHGDKAEALQHLVNIGENLAAMVAFAIGGRVVGSLKAKVLSTEFFNGTEAITRADNRSGLWRPRLAPYSQSLEGAEQWAADSKGIFQTRGQSWINIEGSVYSVTFDPQIGQWRINHPSRLMAYRPALHHNFQGGWQHAFERPEQWRSVRYGLTRLDPGLEAISETDLEDIAGITQMSLPEVQRLALAHEALPQRFQDCVARFKQHHKVADLIEQLGRGETPAADTARTQMLALPLMPGWPKGRFFEVLGEDEVLLESYPDVAPFDYEDLSIHITQRQLKEGQVMQTLLQALSDEERSTLLGQSVTSDQAQTLLQRRLLDTLNARQQALTQVLYEDQDGLAKGVLKTLKDAHPELSNRMAWELLSKATDVQRRRLRISGRVSLGLAERARKAVGRMQVDCALTGLYLPEQALPATRRIALGATQHLSGWPRDIFLQLRQQSIRGEVLAEAGRSSARTKCTLVQTAEGFQAFDKESQPLGNKAGGPYGFYRALLDTVPALQRARLNLQGDWAPQQLLSRIRATTRDQRHRMREYLWAEQAPVEAPVASCIQASPPALPPVAPALMRKLRRLYPLMDDGQLSQLIQGAGTEALTQAKAVEALEQQFAALHRALKIWRSDRSAYNPQDTPLSDYRLTRYQVATAIEQAWKRMLHGGNHHGNSVESLSLDSMLGAPLPMLPAHVQFDHLEVLSLNDMKLDHSVAYFLKHFKNLRYLSLSGNHVTRLPEALSHMSALEYLNLTHNGLQLTQHTRATLGKMHSLQVLILTGNKLLNPPDVSGLSKLRKLMLNNCQLMELPYGADQVPYLEKLDLSANLISELPGWVSDMKPKYAQAFNLKLNPLDPRSQQLLRDYRANYGVGMGYQEDDIAHLTEQKARENWLPDQRAADFAEKNRTWVGLRDEPNTDGFFNVLAQLGSTQDAILVREDLERRVWRVLDACGSDTRLREELFDFAATRLNCDNAAAESFSNLEVVVERHEASRLSRDGQLTQAQLLELATRLFRLDRVQRLASDYVAEHPGVDALEVNLAFRSGLASELNLPNQPRYIHRVELSGVTAADLAAARDIVNAQEQSARLLDFLVELPLWREHLESTHEARFQAVREPYDTRMDGLFEVRRTLKNGDYTVQAANLRAERMAAEKAELEHLTREVLRQDVLGRQGACAIP